MTTLLPKHLCHVCLVAHSVYNLKCCIIDVFADTIYYYIFIIIPGC